MRSKDGQHIVGCTEGLKEFRDGQRDRQTGHRERQIECRGRQKNRQVGYTNGQTDASIGAVRAQDGQRWQAHGWTDRQK